MNEFLRIGKKGKNLLLLDENNKPLKGQIFIRLHDEVHSTPTAVVKLFVNLDEIKQLDE